MHANLGLRDHGLNFYDQIKQEIKISSNIMKIAMIIWFLLLYYHRCSKKINLENYINSTIVQENLKMKTNFNPLKIIKI